jgi:glycosyltransferase involved in cell wall biosynthesis
MMHILHIETGQHLYGGALQVLHLMEGLKKQGFQNTLAYVKDSEINRAAEEFSDIYGIPMSGELDPAFFFRLLKIIRNARPDIVHIHSRRGADIWGGIAAALAKTGAVITRRVDNPEHPWIAKFKYRLYDRVITISEGIKRVLLSEGVPLKKITCIPSAINTRPFEGRCQKSWFYKEFNLNPESKIIGVIGQLIKRKGHRYLINAAPEILKKYPHTMFLFFGKGPLKKQLRRLCDEKNIASRVYFAGFRTDLERILPCLDLIVHPATMEGLGVSLLQAAASRLPIVATRVGGIPEIVHDGVNGYLVNSGNIKEITRAVINLLENPAMSKKFGQAGHNIVSSHFSIEAMVKGNICVYKNMLSERKNLRLLLKNYV